jgi:hypothetical protein
MAGPTTPLPDGAELGHAAERPLLEGFLAYFRAVLARKAEGLTEEEARMRPCPPSDLSMLGLVRHMAEVERIWAEWIFAGGENRPVFYGDGHPDGDMDGDFHPPDGATLDEAFDEYWSQIRNADRVYAGASLEQTQAGGEQEHSLRWIYVHLIEEYARHCGHADLIRQAIDGATDD